MTSPTQRPEDAQPDHWLGELLQRRSADVLQAWTQVQSATRGAGARVEVLPQGADILTAISDCLLRGARVDDPSGPEFLPVRRIIADISVRGARAGATPTETATGVLALREAVLEVLHTEDAPPREDAVVTVGRLVDSLALFTFETYVRGREDVISRQGQQLLELSTPVVSLWDGIIAVPLVGTLDSNRAQIVMETLLQRIIDDHALIAILDITGVPTVDTLVAQHLLKTVTATRLMGADCIISGIRPQTAQTIVQLGIDLTEITTRATLADALALAIQRIGAPSTRPSDQAG